MNDNKELLALISLVDEPDDQLYTQVCERIYGYGYAAIPALESAWESAFDALVQNRLIHIIHDIQQRELYSELGNWAKFGSSDLLKGFLIVTKFQYPDLDLNAVTREVGRIVQDVWLELNDNLTALEKIKVVNHVIYGINKFSGNTTNIQSPENFYLKQLLETKKGNPLSLGMLYILIARSLKIPIYGVNLPRHFVLAYIDETQDEADKSTDEAHVLFYLNPFNKGAIFTRNEIDLYIKQLKLEPSKEYFQPCSNIDIVRRMINGLIETYGLSSNEEKIDALKVLIKSLDT